MASEERDEISTAAVEDEGGVEDAVLELDDPHPGEAVAEPLDDVPEQVVGQRSRRLDPLLRVGDGGGLRRTDPDGQVAVAVTLSQQHDRVVGRHLDPDPEDVQNLHSPTVPRRPMDVVRPRLKPSLTRAACRADAQPQASPPSGRLGRRVRLARGAGATTCWTRPISRSAAVRKRPQVPGLDAVCREAGSRVRDGQGGLAVVTRRRPDGAGRRSPAPRGWRCRAWPTARARSRVSRSCRAAVERRGGRHVGVGGRPRRLRAHRLRRLSRRGQPAVDGVEVP